MKSDLLLTVILLTLFLPSAVAQNTGEELFNTTCAACHTINKGRLIGPDLKGIYNLRDNDWLIRFIQSSQKMIKEGDPDAVAIFNEFNKIPMPDNNITAQQVNSILDFIRETDQKSLAEVPAVTADTSAAVTVDTAAIVYTSQDLAEGRALFSGHTGFKNGASPCMGCHNIPGLSVLGGGKLALDLTGSYTKLGPDGIRAILSNPPFPVMQSALRNHNLEESEIQSLVLLFKSLADRPPPYRIPGSAGMFFSIVGFVCALFLIAIIYILYDNRQIS